MSISTQDIMDNGTVDMRAILRQIKQQVMPNFGFIYKLRYLGENIWTLRIQHPVSPRYARIEIIVDEYDTPEERGARGAVFKYGDIPREQVALIMDSIMERL
jgi:hypothetical protein